MVELTQFHDLAVRRNVLQKAVSRSVIFQFAPIPHLHLGHFSLAVNGTNPGYCFKMAGWRKCGRSAKHDLIIYEKLITPSAFFHPWV